ncbi:hypothetical protein [Microbacterium sp. bgisy189]|uniref:hypothetical protein n=1 Tax=Microbacterium sp. bgisy189 TaxID=3413798 RepID=UPI003EC0715B
MGKNLGLILGGCALIGVFLAWMLFKGTSAIQAWLAPNPLLGPVALGIAWLCLLGGAALIARVIVRRRPEPTDETD